MELPLDITTLTTHSIDQETIMTQINITLETAERLAEVMEAAGLPHLEGAIDYLLDYYDGTSVIEQEALPVSSSDILDMVDKAVNSITNFNASMPVVILSQVVDDSPAPIPLLFSELQTDLFDDPLVKLATQMGETEQQALAFIYSNIPSDIWGTDQAHRMWDRQIYFDKARGA
jgi:hypothetical protein